MKSCLVSSYIPPAPQHIPVDPRLLTYLKRNSKVIDTPGFGDSSGKDNQYIQEMMDILDNTGCSEMKDKQNVDQTGPEYGIRKMSNHNTVILLCGQSIIIKSHFFHFF